MAFYTYKQNNSGGYYVKDSDYGVGEFIIIEAPNERMAWAIMEEIGENVGGLFDYCPCSGKRWSDFKPETHEKYPVIYEEPIETYTHWGTAKAYVHYLDGTIKQYNIKSNYP